MMFQTFNDIAYSSAGAQGASAAAAAADPSKKGQYVS